METQIVLFDKEEKAPQLPIKSAVEPLYVETHCGLSALYMDSTRFLLSVIPFLAAFGMYCGI
ncbi:MAG: hypothetical protein RSA66_06615 [Muribaculaceae bacterium]